MTDHCCAPQRPEVGRVAPPREAARPGRRSPIPVGERHLIEQAELPGGTFTMGDQHGDGLPADGETPLHQVTLSPYSIDVTAVSNADFARFVDATGFRTDAEVFGFSAVFHLVVQAKPSQIMSNADGTPWWIGVHGADWRHPRGPLSDLDGLDDHPVTHISFNDARTYCRWAKRRLPTEAEWEFAARGGIDGARYPWGDDLDLDDWACNIWQGTFPKINTEDDGWLTTAPVRSYEPNGYGLWQPVGNVWEWCADWFDPRYYRSSPDRDPAGPPGGRARVLRGGSYLCHDSYCNRYRNAARSSNTPDSSMGNAGFRTVSAR